MLTEIRQGIAPGAQGPLIDASKLGKVEEVNGVRRVKVDREALVRAPIPRDPVVIFNARLARASMIAGYEYSENGKRVVHPFIIVGREEDDPETVAAYKASEKATRRLARNTGMDIQFSPIVIRDGGLVTARQMVKQDREENPGGWHSEVVFK